MPIRFQKVGIGFVLVQPVTPVFNEVHVRGVLKEYLAYYNHARPHQGLNQQIPIQSSITSSCEVRYRNILGGLIRDYYRAA
jgi:hypothetical protein